jgi:hypothetical protein
MITYSQTEFLKLVGKYDTAIFAYMEEVGTSEGNKSIISQLFNRADTTEPELAISGSGAHSDMKKFKGSRNYEDLKELYTKRISFEEFDKAEQFDRKTLDDNKIWSMKERSGSLLRTYYRTCENFAAAIFNNISASSFTKDGETYTWTLCADGQPISDDAHTTVSGRCSTVDNETTSQLDGDNLETAIQTMAEFQDDSGNQGSYFADTMMVPGRLAKTAMELLNSEGKPNVTNNNYNIYDGRFRLIVWNRYTKLSGTTYYPWLVMDSVSMKENLFWFDRINPEITDFRDFNSMSWSVGIYTRFGCGTYDKERACPLAA